jgi:hypothetical protein
MERNKLKINGIINGISILIISASLLLISGCVSDFCVEGSGNVISETRTVESFHSVEFNGMGNVYVAQDGTSSIKVEAEDNIIPILKTYVRDGVLVINMDKACAKNTKPVNVYVSMNEVKKLALSGSGSITGKSEIASDDLEVIVSGSGKIDMPVKTKSLKSEISGSGESTFTGTAASHNAIISGSGKLNAYDLKTEKTEIQITGSGKSEITALDGLTVRISGSGDVYYKGNPEKIKQEITGSGKVTKVE